MISHNVSLHDLTLEYEEFFQWKQTIAWDPNS